MCYGLQGSPATFARLMRKVVSQMPSERQALYMDDLCVVSETFEDHLRNVQELFDALRHHGLRIKAKKCVLAMREVTFLGHKVSKNGIEPVPHSVCKTKSRGNHREYSTSQLFEDLYFAGGAQDVYQEQNRYGIAVSQRRSIP